MRRGVWGGMRAAKRLEELNEGGGGVEVKEKGEEREEQKEEGARR